MVPKSCFSRSGPPPGALRGPNLFSRDLPGAPKAHLGAPRAARNPPKRAQEPPRARSNLQSLYVKTLVNMCVWPPGISKKHSRTIIRCSEYPPGTLQCGDPTPRGRLQAPKKVPGSSQGPPRSPPGPREYICYHRGFQPVKPYKLRLLKPPASRPAY